MKRRIISGNGYGDADEVSFVAMATTQGFLGSLQARMRKKKKKKMRTMTDIM